MAQVPTYGLQQEMPKGSVSPVQLHVPNDNALMNYAGQMDKAVGELDAVVQKAAEQMDKARVTDAETQLYKFMVDRRMGENGYSNLKMQQAMEPDADGNSLPDREDIAMRERIKEISKDMGLNARQLQMFNQRAQTYRRQQYGAASQHVYQEAQSYMKATSTNMLNEAMRSAMAGFGEPDTVLSALAHAQEAMLALNPGADEQMQTALLREAADKVLGAAIDGALAGCDKDPDALRSAQGIMERHGNLMNPDAVAKNSDKIRKVQDIFDLDGGAKRINEALRSNDTGPFNIAFGGILAAGGIVPMDKIPRASDYLFARMIVMQETGGKQAKKTKNAAGEDVYTVQIGRYGTTNALPKDESKWAYGVSQMQLGNAKYAAEKLLGIPWDKKLFTGTSEEARQYNFKLGQAFFGEMLRKAKGDMVLAAAYYHDGETIVNEAIKKGKAEGKPWSDYLGPDGRKYVADFRTALNKLRDDSVMRADGTKVDQFNVREVAASRGAYSRLSVEKWIEANAATDPTCARAAIDPIFRDRLVQKTLDRQKAEQDDYVNTQTNLLARATDLVLQGKTVPTSITSQLTYAQQERLEKFAHDFANGIDSGDIGYASFLYGPGSENFLAMDEESMKLAVLQCPKAQRQQLVKAWYDNQNAMAAAHNAGAARDSALARGQILPQFQVHTNMIRGQLNLILSGDPKRKKAFGEGGIERAVAVLHPILAQEMQMAGIKPDEASVRTFIQNYLSTSYAVDGFFGVVNGKSVFDLKAEDLPNNGLDDAWSIVEQLTRNRMGEGYRGEITPEMMMQTFQYLMLAPRPQIRFVGLKLNQELWDELIRNAPDDASYVRMLRRYLASRIAGLGPQPRVVDYNDDVFQNGGEQ